jgi:hypothetical protein
MNLKLSESGGLGQILIPLTSTLPAASGGSSTLATSAIAGPIGLAVGGAITALQVWWSRSKLAGQRRITATEVVNQVEPVLQQNLDGYFGISNRSTALQSEALKYFDEMWDVVVDACGVDELGQAGRRCISDRERGGQFHWFERYRDPIANDTEVREATLIETVLPQDLQAVFSGVPWELILGVGLIGAVLLVGRK